MHSESKETKMKNRKFPSATELNEAVDALEHTPGTRLLPDDAPIVDKLKFELCKSFIAYKQENNLTQKELADKLDIDPALMSKILHYQFDEFTIDRLVKFLENLHKDVSIKIA